MRIIVSSASDGGPSNRSVIVVAAQPPPPSSRSTEHQHNIFKTYAAKANEVPFVPPAALLFLHVPAHCGSINTFCALVLGETNTLSLYHIKVGQQNRVVFATEYDGGKVRVAVKKKGREREREREESTKSLTSNRVPGDTTTTRSHPSLAWRAG